MTTPTHDGELNGLPAMTKYQRAAWDAEAQAAYERMRQLDHETRELLEIGFITCLQDLGREAIERKAS